MASTRGWTVRYLAAERTGRSLEPPSAQAQLRPAWRCGVTQRLLQGAVDVALRSSTEQGAHFELAEVAIGLAAARQLASDPHVETDRLATALAGVASRDALIDAVSRLQPLLVRRPEELASVRALLDGDLANDPWSSEELELVANLAMDQRGDR